MRGKDIKAIDAYKRMQAEAEQKVLDHAAMNLEFSDVSGSDNEDLASIDADNRNEKLEIKNDSVDTNSFSIAKTADRPLQAPDLSYRQGHGAQVSHNLPHDHQPPRTIPIECCNFNLRVLIECKRQLLTGRPYLSGMNAFDVRFVRTITQERFDKVLWIVHDTDRKLYNQYLYVKDNYLVKQNGKTN